MLVELDKATQLAKSECLLGKTHSLDSWGNLRRFAASAKANVGREIFGRELKHWNQLVGNQCKGTALKHAAGEVRHEGTGLQVEVP